MVDMEHENIEVTVFEDSSEPLEPLQVVTLAQKYGRNGREMYNRLYLYMRRMSGSSDSSCASIYPPSDRSKSSSELSASSSPAGSTEFLNLPQLVVDVERLQAKIKRLKDEKKRIQIQNVELQRREDNVEKQLEEVETQLAAHVLENES